MGDGSYMFANPTVCHQVAEALDLPVLVLVLNNAAWRAVRATVQGLYPDGYAAKATEMPLAALKPAPAITQTPSASRPGPPLVLAPPHLARGPAGDHRGDAQAAVQ